ncbi:hypothetical protein SRHO_G00099530 [Serrasalmus rhombeus]
MQQYSEIIALNKGPRAAVDLTMEKPDAAEQGNEETKSTHSVASAKSSGKLTVRSSAGCSSRSSASTRASMEAARAQAEAQAAKARLAYAEKEMSIKIEKARLEASLDVLNLQKEADAAVAKAEVMEAAAAQLSISEPKEELPFLAQQTTPEEKVKLNYPGRSQKTWSVSEHVTGLSDTD